METAAAITNDFQRFQLWNIAATVPHPGAQETARGPYMVVQEGSAPGDPASRKCAFVLTRRGTWLHCYLFFMLPEPVRRGVGVFESVQEVMDRSERLTGKPRVETAKTVPDLLASTGYEWAGPEAETFLQQIARHEPPSETAEAADNDAT